MEYGQEYIGKRVIVRSNEDEPLLFGTFKGFTPDTLIPLVEDQDGKQWLCMGIIVPDTPRMVSALSSLTPKGQWEWLREISCMIQVVHGADRRAIARKR